ncbi:hypothetical protein [Aestuariimicrobium ganziense]|uniref:hypothetical protein n=1 Tax=Aestuariimicrobium ganziense TaxID=2773677 RepID=UPI0019440B24|nr:hypothetical protein [Aestuariimicrobium ganziense]
MVKRQSAIAGWILLGLAALSIFVPLLALVPLFVGILLLTIRHPGTPISGHIAAAVVLSAFALFFSTIGPYLLSR